MWTHELTVGETETDVTHQTSIYIFLFLSLFAAPWGHESCSDHFWLKHRKISTKASVSTAAMTSEVVSQV